MLDTERWKPSQADLLVPSIAIGCCKGAVYTGILMRA